MKKLNRTGDKGQTCWRPTCNGNKSLELMAMWTRLLLASYTDQTALNRGARTSYLWNTWNTTILEYLDFGFTILFAVQRKIRTSCILIFLWVQKISKFQRIKTKREMKRGEDAKPETIEYRSNTAKTLDGWLPLEASVMRSRWLGSTRSRTLLMNRTPWGFHHLIGTATLRLKDWRYFFWWI